MIPRNWQPIVAAVALALFLANVAVYLLMSHR